MSTGAIVEIMRPAIDQNPNAIFNVRKLADSTGLSSDSVVRTVQEWIFNGWANIHPEDDAELYEFVVTTEGLDELFA